MSTAAPVPTAGPDPTPSLRASGRGALLDSTFRALALAAGASVLVVLGYIAFSTTKQAWPAFRHQGLGIVTRNDWQPQKNIFGGFPLVYATLVTSLIALVIAVPVSIGVALFSTEYAPKRVKTLLVSLVDLLASVPSVVFGLWGVLVLGRILPGFYLDVHSAVSGIPVLRDVFGPNGHGQSIMTAGIVLAIMIVPIISSITREVFATVPQAEKDAALALGATRWEMLRAAVFPYSLGGMTGAVMIGLGRALGETIAVALVVGSQAQVTKNVFKSGETIASAIANQFAGENPGLPQQALIGLGVVLFVITIAVNLVARLIVGRAQRRIQGAA